MSLTKFNLATAALLQAARHFGFTLDDLARKDRTEPLATCRHLAIKLAHQRSGMCHRHLAKILFRHHSSITLALAAADAILATENQHRVAYASWLPSQPSTPQPSTSP